MGRIHGWLGLTVGLILPGYQRPRLQAAQYACDITYGTNNEFGLRLPARQHGHHAGDKVQRGHNYAIVDEVDSILIDEARTPLIISGKVADAAKLYYRFASIVRGLKRDVDYEVDEEKRVVAHRGGHREGRAGARHREPVRRGPAEPGAPAPVPRSRPRSCTSATRTTSSRPAR
jgi:preprotein translocase subunit SecA